MGIFMYEYTYPHLSSVLASKSITVLNEGPLVMVVKVSRSSNLDTKSIPLEIYPPS